MHCTSAWMNILYISGRITGATCGIWMSVTSRQNSEKRQIQGKCTSKGLVFVQQQNTNKMQAFPWLCQFSATTHKSTIFTSFFIVFRNLDSMYSLCHMRWQSTTKTILEQYLNTRGLILYLLKLSLLHEPGYHRHLLMPASDVQTSLATPQASPNGRLQR